jgi:hypothetical protein
MAAIRVEAPTGALVLTSAPYGVTRDGIDPGAVTWRRHDVQSPFVHGSVLVHAVRDQATGTLELECHHPEAAGVWAAVDAAIAAFTAYSYLLVREVDGITHTWRCDPADYAITDTYARLAARVVQVRFSFPRYPITE